MSRRVDSKFLLLGSLPVESAEQAFETCGPMFGDSCFALPDGETGTRAIWVVDEAYRLWNEHPDIETLHRPNDPPSGLPDWAPGGWFDLWSFRVKDGVSDFHIDRWPRVDDAIESYRLFRSYREDGTIPEDVRFQICLPWPASSMGFAFHESFEHDYALIEPALEDLVHREVDRLLAEAPAEDLAFQWDVCFEVLDLERLWTYTDPERAWSRYADLLPRLSSSIPEEALLGYHLCYGTFPEWPMREADDMGIIVRMANAAVRDTSRKVDYLHLAGLRHLRSEEDAFYAPLEELEPGDAKVYLGLAMPIDGARGLNARVRTARRHLSDFGVANYCGFGRQPGEDPAETLREHRELVDEFTP